MKQESGRSLVEVMGVLAITAIMSASAIGLYSMIRKNQTRQIAATQLQQIAKNTKLLLEMRGDYTGVSVDYLIDAGALKNSSAPIGGDNWSVVATTDGTAFSINLVDLSEGECNYFTTIKTDWATTILVNGYETDAASRCFSSKTNQISFIVQ